MMSLSVHHRCCDLYPGNENNPNIILYVNIIQKIAAVIMINIFLKSIAIVRMFCQCCNKGVNCLRVWEGQWEGMVRERAECVQECSDKEMRKPIEKLGLQKKWCKFRVSCFHVSEIGKWDQCHVNKPADRRSRKIRTAQADRLAGRTRVFNHIYIKPTIMTSQNTDAAAFESVCQLQTCWVFFFFLLKIRSWTKSVSVFPSPLMTFSWLSGSLNINSFPYCVCNLSEPLKPDTDTQMGDRR